MEFVELETKNDVLHIRLNRPEIRNAFNPKMIGEVTKALADAGKESTLRAVVISGNGQSFCAGADLNYMKSMVDFSVAENRKDSEILFDMFYTLKNMEIPTIAKVHGHVMGGAIGLLAACDVGVAEKETQFCFSEVRLGIAPAVISPFVIKKTNKSFYTRYLVSAEMFGVDIALRGGLISEVHPADEMDAAVEKILKRFKSNGKRAVRATKNLISYVEENNSWINVKNETTKVIADLRVSEEGQEGLRSFLEKRKPNWIQE